MRLFKNSQMRIGEVDIGSIKLDKSSRDDVPRLLMGLQSVYLNKVLLKKISDIMMEEMLPKVNKKDGRYGMDFWNIFVLHVVKRGASIDYDRLRDYANSHIELRKFLGISFEQSDYKFGLQTIKNNLGLMSEEVLKKINAEIIKHGHDLLPDKDTNDLRARGDSFVYKTGVEYPTDIGLLEDSLIGAINVASKLSSKYKVNGLRESESAMRKTKRLKNKAQQSKKFRNKNNPDKYQEQTVKPHKKLINYASKILAKITNSKKEIEEKIKEVAKSINPKNKKELKSLEKDKEKIENINFYAKETERQINQIERRVINGEVIPHSEKIFSVYKSYTEWINKGKAGVPFELGVRMAIIEDNNGFILNHKIMYNQTDEKIAVDFLKDTMNMFPNINSISYDRGFWSKQNLQDLEDMGVDVGMPKKGKLNKKDTERQDKEEYKKAKDKHSAIESAINGLQHHGGDICRDYSKDKYESHAASSVISKNLIRIGDIIIEKEDRRQRRKKYTFQNTSLQKAA